MNTARKFATYNDVLDAPPHLVAELIQGVLYTQPRPAPKHSLAIGGISDALRSPFGRGRSGPGGWIFLIEPELHLLGDVLVPDLAAWRRERMPKLPDTAYIDIAPDWICEVLPWQHAQHQQVLSPGNARFDRGVKMPRYASAGVRYAWLIDPSEQTLEVFILGQQQQPAKWVLQHTFAGSEAVFAEPFDALPFVLGDLWEL